MKRVQASWAGSGCRYGFPGMVVAAGSLPGRSLLWPAYSDYVAHSHRLGIGPALKADEYAVIDLE